MRLYFTGRNSDRLLIYCFKFDTRFYKANNNRIICILLILNSIVALRLESNK